MNQNQKYPILQEEEEDTNIIDLYTLIGEYTFESFEMGSISKKSGQNILSNLSLRSKVFYKDISYTPGEVYLVSIQNRVDNNKNNCILHLFFYDKNHIYVGESSCIDIPNETDEFLLEFPENSSYLRFTMERKQSSEEITKNIRPTINDEFLESMKEIIINVQKNPYSFHTKNDYYLTIDNSYKDKYILYEKIDFKKTKLFAHVSYSSEDPESTWEEIRVIGNFKVRNFETIALSPVSSSKKYYLQWYLFECPVNYEVLNSNTKNTVTTIQKPYSSNIVTGDQPGIEGKNAIVDHDHDDVIYDPEYSFYEIIVDSDGKETTTARITHIGIKALKTDDDGKYTYVIPGMVYIENKRYDIVSIGSNACEKMDSDYTIGTLEKIYVESPPTQTEYDYNSKELILSGLVVKKHYKNQEPKEDPVLNIEEDLHFFGFDGTIPGDQVIKVQYSENETIFETSFQIKVKDAPVVTLKVKEITPFALPNKINYTKNEFLAWKNNGTPVTFDTTGLIIHIKYDSDDESSDTNMVVDNYPDSFQITSWKSYEDVLSKFQNTKDGSYPIQVTYLDPNDNNKEHNTTFNITLKKVKSSSLSYSIIKDTDEDKTASIRSKIQRLVVQTGYSPSNGGLIFERSCFEDCQQLEEIQCNGPVLTIESRAFYNSGLKTVTIRPETTAIKESAFFGCSHLKSIIIRERKSSITYGNQCFWSIASPSIIMVPDENRKNEIVKNDRSDYFDMSAGTVEIGTVSVLDEKGYDEDGNQFTLDPDTKSCILLGSESTVNVVNIPSKVLMEDGGIYPVSKIQESAYLKSSISQVIIHSDITIGDHAFDGCHSLHDVVTGDYTLQLGEGSFKDCVSFNNEEKNNIIKKLTTIPKECFSGCTNIQSMTFSDNLTEIHESAFENCSNLQSIVFPPSVRAIKDYAFKNGAKINTIIFHTKTCTLGKELLGEGDDCVIYVDDPSMMDSVRKSFTGESRSVTLLPNNSYQVTLVPGTLDTYQDKWGVQYQINDLGAVMTSAKNMTIPLVEKGVYGIPNSIYILNGSTKTESFLINITEGCFENVSPMVYDTESKMNIPGLTTVIFPSGIETIPKNCFKNCSVRRLEIPNVKYIGDYAFSGTSISDEKDIPLPVSCFGTKYDDQQHKNVFTGPIGLFENCTQLKRIEHMFDGISYIPLDTFKGCSGLETVIINHDMILGDPSSDQDCDIFYGCSSMRNIYLLAKNITVQKGIFRKGTLRETTFSTIHTNLISPKYATTEQWNDYNGTFIHVLSSKTYESLKSKTHKGYHLNLMSYGELSTYPTSADEFTIPVPMVYEGDSSFDLKKTTFTIQSIKKENEENTYQINMVRENQDVLNLVIPSHMIYHAPLLEGDDTEYYQYITFTQFDPEVTEHQVTWEELVYVTDDGVPIYTTMTYTPHNHVKSKWTCGAGGKKCANMYSGNVMNAKLLSDDSNDHMMEMYVNSVFQKDTLHTILLPYTIRSLPSYLFVNAQQLQKISFPKYLESIGEGCFAYCTKLYNKNDQSSWIPITVRSIGARAFCFCFPKSESYVLEIPPRVTNIEDVLLYGSDTKGCNVYTKEYDDLILGQNCFGYTPSGFDVGFQTKDHYDNRLMDNAYKNRSGCRYTLTTYYYYLCYPNDGVTRKIHYVNLPNNGIYPTTTGELSDYEGDKYEQSNQYYSENKLEERLSIFHEVNSIRNQNHVDILPHINSIKKGDMKDASLQQLVFIGDITLEKGSWDEIKTIPREIFFLGNVAFDVSDWDSIFQESETKFYVSSYNVYRQLLHTFPYLYHRIAYVSLIQDRIEEQLLMDDQGMIYQIIGLDKVQLRFMYYPIRKKKCFCEVTFLHIPSYIYYRRTLYTVEFDPEVLTYYQHINRLFLDVDQISSKISSYKNGSIIPSKPSPYLSNGTHYVIPYEENTYTDGYGVFTLEKPKDDCPFAYATFHHMIQTTDSLYNIPKEVISVEDFKQIYIVNQWSNLS